MPPSRIAALAREPRLTTSAPELHKSVGGNGLGYAKDARAVYYDWDRIPGADPATFVADPTRDSMDARDKNHKYLGGQIVK